MHGYSRLGPNFTPSSPMKPNGPGIGGRKGPIKLMNFIERLVYWIIGTILRRKGLLLILPFLYIGIQLYIGAVTFEGKFGMKFEGNFKGKILGDGKEKIELENGFSVEGHKIIGLLQNKKNNSTKDFEFRGGFVVNEPYFPGSLYRSPQVFENLLPFLQLEGNHSSHVLARPWPSINQRGWKPCIDAGALEKELPKSNGYFIIEANGGLNQQRLSICDAVAVARLLNATLVIPTFHFNSVWQDSSKFGDIFDEEFFINSLRNKVNIVRELPEDVLLRYNHNISSIVNLRTKAWSSPTYYLQVVLPKLQSLGAVRIAPFYDRLANDVPPEMQALRCFANYEALRFSQSIRPLADVMVQRMFQKSSRSGGKYVSVHLRFERDIIAFSCCIYDGGEEEKQEMDKAREESWKGKFHRRGRIIMPGALRRDGKCPMTPIEVGMMLRGMGFDSSTPLYVAAGKIYKADKYMAPLKELFPLLETKDSLATPEELAQFEGHSSRLAALDYTVCLHSEVFVNTHGGNFDHFLMGHRRYMYGGHAKSILPDKRRLALLFDNPAVRWETFKHQMRDMLRRSDSKGREMKKPTAILYTYPMPDCMCLQGDSSTKHGNSILKLVSRF